MSDNLEPNQTQTEVTSSEQLVGLIPIEGEEHNIGVHLINETDEDFFGAQAIELNGERHVIVSQAQDPETGELLLVLRGENGDHIAIQSEALSSMVQASGGDHIQVAVETNDETALTLASDISSLSESVSVSESNPISTTSLSALPSIIANIPSQPQQTTAPTNVVQAIDTPRVSQEEQPSSLAPVMSITPPVPTTESEQTTTESTTETTVSSLPSDITVYQQIEENKEEIKDTTVEQSVEQPIEQSVEQSVDKPVIEETTPTVEAIEPEIEPQIEPQKDAAEETTNKTDLIPNVSEIDSNITEKVVEPLKVTETREVEETIEIKEPEVSNETIEPIEDKTAEPEPTEPTVENNSIPEMSEKIEAKEILSETEKTGSTDQTVDSELPVVSETVTTVSSPTISSDQITTSCITPAIETTSVSTPLPTTLTETSITSEAVPPSDPEIEEKRETTADTTETVSDLGFGNTAVIQVQDSGNDSSLEQLMANAVLTADGNYVLMAQTEDGQMTGLPSELNLSDVISAGAAGGQTFLIETPEGLVACTASTSGEDGSIQLIPTEAGDLENAVISSAQSSGGSVENQIIQAISGGQPMSYTFNSTSGCLELTAINPPPNPTPPQKASRGGRGSRSNKSKTTPSVPSMGQTLLLTAETETPTVSTKPSTPARSRGTGGKGKANKINESNSSDSTLTSNQLQTKSNIKTTAIESFKSSNPPVKGQTTETTGPPGPSQLAASRRTYSKKSNIVWITPDASQGANSTTFATVATASVKPNINSNSSVNNSVVETSRVRTPSPTKVSSMATIQSSSPTKTITTTPIKNTSPTKALVSTPIQNSVTVAKPVEAKTSSTKAAISTISNKSSSQTTSTDKKETIPKITSNTTATKTVTASKTTASKSITQLSPTKGQTPNLTFQSSATTETTTKTTIRVSDITASKSTVETSTPKTVAQTVVTVSSSKAKSTASTIPSTPSSGKPVVTTNKPYIQSSKKPSIPTTITETTVSSVSKISTSSSAKSSTNSSFSLEKSSKSGATDNTGNNSLNDSNVAISTKSPKASDSSVKPISTPTSTSVKSSVTSESSSSKSVTNSSEKSNKKTSEKAVPNRNVETRHSARLSPSKSIKSDSNSKEMDSNQKSLIESVDTKAESLKTITEKEVTKNVKSDNVDNENKTKTKSRVNVSATVSTPKTPIPEETIKKSELEVDNKEPIEENRSIRKSRRSSRNVSNVEEVKKDIKTVEENKTVDTKTKDTKEIKANDTKETNIKEKIDEISTPSVTTRRTSGRKKEVVSEVKNKESVTVSPVISPTPALPAVAPTPAPQTDTPTSAPTTTPEVKPQRLTRASSGKKPDVKQTSIEENVTKVDPKEAVKPKEAENNSEPKPKSDFDRIIEESKPREKTPEKSEPVSTKTSEPTSATRSVKKRVQFEVNEKDDEKEVTKVTKSSESTEKTNEPTVGSTPTRRSLRSSTPQTTNQTKTDVQPNENEISENIDNSDKQLNENNSKTPQRFSTRKRKEVTKTPEIEVKEVNKSPKKPKKSETNELEANINHTTPIDSIDTPSVTRLRDRKSKSVKRFEPRNPIKETIRHSIETSDPFGRINRKQSLIQSFIDENEWQEKEENLRRKTISSLSDLRSPNECYDYSTNECSFYIRHQSASLTPKQSTGNYLCQKCGFHTTRINNLVIHHRDQCSYVKNQVIQQWQTELQKRVRPVDTSLTASTSVPETKRRKTDDNDITNSLDKNTDLSDEESEDEEMTTTNDKTNQNNPTISDIDAMLMGSDDEDLLSIDNIEKPKRELGFSEDDIVWVETNSTHWPALVTKVFIKEKKALIRLIDSPWPKKSIKADISSISLFDCAEVNKQYLRDGRKASNGDVLVKAVQKAEEFLRKKCLGSELIATKFFDQIDSDLSETNAEEDNEERLNISTKDSVPIDDKETAKTSNDSSLDASSSAVGCNGDDTEDEKMPESSEAIAKWKEKRRQQNAKLLQCIKDGKVETHLVGVYRESIASERHQKFKSGSEIEKNQLKHVPWFGPIDDEEQQEEIYDYCSQLFKSNFKTDTSFDTVAYIFEVWVPEAIVKAISRVRRIELSDSESIFAKGVILSQTEKDEMNKEIQKEAEKHMTSSQTSSD